jgi:hypothetical protein
VADPHTGPKGFWWRRHEAIEGGLGVAQLALGWSLADDLAALLGIVTGLEEGAMVLDDVLGGLDDDEALDVEASPPCAAGDLVELPGAQDALAAAVDTS